MHKKVHFFHTLNNSIKDELIVLDEPETLDELIRLAVKLDNRIKERSKERTRRAPNSPPSPSIVPQVASVR